MSVGREFHKQFKNEFEYILIDVEDNRNSNILVFLDPTITEMFRFLMDGKKVFVHCYAGISRSVSVICG